MKARVILKRIFHHNEWRYSVDFGYDINLVNIVRSIKGARWSQSNRCWHIPHDEDTLKELLRLLQDKAFVDSSELAKVPVTEASPEFTGTALRSDAAHAGVLQSKDINSPGSDFLPAKQRIENAVYRKSFGPVEFRINEKDGRLAIRFLGIYDKKWIDEIRTFGRYIWNGSSKEFLLPWSLSTVDSLSDYFSSIGVKVNVVKTVPPEALRHVRQDAGDKIRSRILGPAAIDGLSKMEMYLDEVRYSERTNGSYLALLELFFKYFSDKDPVSILPEEISAFEGTLATVVNLPKRKFLF